MAEPHLSGFNGTATAVAPRLTIEQRNQQLVHTLRAKVDQGYVIESQSDTEAILVTRRRRRWFGLVDGGPGTRQTLTIDGQGSASMRSL
jgi:hypothetical protein